MIRESVEKLGFHYSETKILLISHAHWDHCAGSAAVKYTFEERPMSFENVLPSIPDWRGQQPFPMY